MKHKFIKGIAVSLMSMALLSGCGENDNSIKVIFWTTFNQSMNNEITSIGKKFTKIIKETEGVDVSITVASQGDYDAIFTNIDRGFSTGNTPTLAVAYPDHVANYLAKSKTSGYDYVVNLDNFINSSTVGFDKEEELNPSLLGVEDIVASYYDEGQHYIKEGTYSMPFLKSTEILTYNTEIVQVALNKMGIQTGVENYMKNITYSDFIELVKFVGDHKSEFDGVDEKDFVPWFYDSDSNLFITQCFQRGINYISMNDGSGSIDFVNDGAKAMIQEYKELYSKGYMTTKGITGEYSSNYFKNLQTAFTVGSSGGSGYNDPGVSFTAGICKMPSYTTDAERAKYVSQGLTLTILNNSSLSKEVNDERTLYAWKFLKYILNEENNIDMALYSQGYVPVRESCYKNEEYAEYISTTDTKNDYMGVCANAVVNQIKGAYYNYPVFKGSAETRDAVGDIVTNYLLGTKEGYKTLDEAFNTAYTKAIKAL